MARTLFGLNYGTWESAYKCQTYVRLPLGFAIGQKGNIQSKQSRDRIPMLQVEADSFVVVLKVL